MGLSDLQWRQYERAEQEWLREPESEPDRCVCCGCERSNDAELYLYNDEPWCCDCLQYENMNSDDIDELPIYDEDLI